MVSGWYSNRRPHCLFFNERWGRLEAANAGNADTYLSVWMDVYRAGFPKIRKGETGCIRPRHD